MYSVTAGPMQVFVATACSLTSHVRSRMRAFAKGLEGINPRRQLVALKVKVRIAVENAKRRLLTKPNVNK